MISVITPVYNSNKFLRQSISSILNQSYSDFELILIDDGSIDGSSEICDEYAYKDSRIKVFHQKNQGQAVARNRALDIARGKYIAFVDSDDFIHPRMFELMKAYIEQNDADIAVCNLVRGSELDYKWNQVPFSSKAYYGKEFLRNSVLNKEGKHWVLCDKIFKLSCFENVRLPEGRIYEDNATVYKILYNAEKVAVTDNTLYYYYTNEDSTVNQSFKLKHLDWLLVVEEMMDFFSEHQEQEMLNWANNCYLTSLADLHRKVRTNHLDKSVLNELREKLYQQYLTEKKKYTVDIHTYPIVIEELFPVKAKLYWMSKGISSNLKGK